MGAIICLVFLAVRFRTAPKSGKARTVGILFAILALIAIGYQLRTLNHIWKANLPLPPNQIGLSGSPCMYLNSQSNQSVIINPV